MKSARDLAQVRGAAGIDRELAEETLGRLGVDREGLEEMDRRILRCLAQSQGNPVGIKTIAAAVEETGRAKSKAIASPMDIFSIFRIIRLLHFCSGMSA